MSAVQQVLFGIGVSGPPPTPWSARSIKVVVSGYAGHALRVRRSNDNAEQDIDYVGSSINSALDTTALATFVGANSAFVVTWYDQSGNGNNWTQTTQASQPRIVNAGTYDGQVVYDGSNDRLISPNSGSSAVGLTVFAEWELRTSAATDLTHISRGIVDSSHDFWEWQRNTNNSSGFGI